MSPVRLLRRPLFPALVLLVFWSSPANAAWVWIEGEQPASTNIRPHPWYAGEVKQDLLSGGGFLAHFDETKDGRAEYRFTAPAAGPYTLWVRANPAQTSLRYSLNGASPAAVSFDEPVGGTVNIAADGKPDLRFLAWINAGTVALKSGANRIDFTMDSANHHHGALDCFVFTNEPFTPSGTLKPDQLATAAARLAADNQGWIPWNPAPDDFKPSPIDLRPLNEKFAGEHGWIRARGDQLIRSGDDRPVRFWAVNGDGGGDVTRGARVLANYGVNLVRLHGGLYDEKTGELDSSLVTKRIASIEALKGQGIYSLFSIYFPLWVKPTAGPGWREGYDGAKNPFALLYFEPEFLALYRSWWKEILSAKTSAGTALVNEPALMALELVNEDSLFFWTFKYKNIPDPQMRKLEKRFGDWAARKYGSLPAALSSWNNLPHPRDDLGEGRLGFRLLYDMVTRKTPRDQATAAFLFELQRDFYADTVRYIRSLGYKGLITSSNWTTADNDILGPLEKLSYMPGDFIDHHGYFGANHSGDNSAWSVREGHTYSDVSALRFDSEERGKPRAFFNPVMDPMYNRRPSMISEIAWNRPSRHRGEAPLFISIYGSLQDTDALVHFSFDSSRWTVKPRFFMQPWTLMCPTQVGQFPAAAFLYRQGLVKTGELMADLPMTVADALALKGSRLVQKANLDELRKSDVGKDGDAQIPNRGIDPLIHLVGRTNVGIDEKGGKIDIKDLAPFIDRTAQTVLSSTREIKLDYGKGVLALNAPGAQGVSGDLRKAGPLSLGDVTITSPLEVGHIIAIALDGRPLATSKRLLVQAMTEDKPSDFATEPAKDGVYRITRLGRDPWLMREIAGNVRFKRPDAARLRVTALDFNGYPVKEIGNAAAFDLLPGHAYYLITDGPLGR